MKPALIEKTRWLALVSALLFSGCATDDEPVGDSSPAVEDPILEDLAVLFDGAPTNDELPDLAKADQNFPVSFTELTELQSPVKSQGSRGVCSIFSTAGYMEHLYKAEGTITDLDISEQYLQWSVKFEINSFPATGGSNANYNLQAINQFGIPREEAWPYQSSKWTSSDDAECDGEDDQPTRCYTNGEPPADALTADKLRLPAPRWVSTRTRDVKAHIFNKKQGVVVGLTFFYQSWNHRRSELPRNMDYWNNGYVLYPNGKDTEISLEKGAGHSILLLGWNDELEVPLRDEAGNKLLDDNGDELTERGFFLFKNSWGTGSFGNLNAAGDGYGWISFRYVSEYGRGRVSDLPELDVVLEVCGDGVDNDGNFATDCDDDACSADPICTSSSEIIEVELPSGGLAIPDNDSSGVDAPFEVTGPGEISAMTLTVDITHTWQGDISVTLVHPDGTSAELQAISTDSEHDLQRSYVVEAFASKEAAGEYRLIVADHAAIDTGTLNAATIELVR